MRPRQLAHNRQYALPGSTLVGGPFAFLGSGDEVVGGEGQSDGLVVVFVGVVVHSVYAWAGFSEPDVGEFIEKLCVLGEREALFPEEEVDCCSEPPDRLCAEVEFLDSNALAFESLGEVNCLPGVEDDGGWVIGGAGLGEPCFDIADLDRVF